MITSPRRGISHPALDRSDPPDIPAHIQILIDALELDVFYRQDIIANRPVSTVGTPGVIGRVFFSTDETPRTLYWDYGTGWQAIGSLGAGSVGTLQLVDASVTTVKLADSSVTSAKIVDGTITGADIAAGSVTSSHIADGTIVAADIAADTITATQIAANAIGASELADNAVDTAAIAASAVTNPKIAPGITPSKVGSFGTLPSWTVSIDDAGARNVRSVGLAADVAAMVGSLVEDLRTLGILT